MKEVLAKLSKVSKMRRTLQRSLTASRQTSPVSTPKVHRTKQGRKEQARLATTSHSKNTKETSKQEKREYSQLFNSLVKIKQGNTNYADIVANAMEATDNIFALKQD